jgi:hypothetical protein
MGTPLRTYKQMSKHGMETHVITQDQNMPSSSEIILTLFWNFSGPIFRHYQHHGQMVSSSAVLEENMKPTICSKHRRMLTKVVLHYDNA